MPISQTTLTETDGHLFLEIPVFQGIDGAVYLGWGTKSIKLEKVFVDNIKHAIPFFDQDAYDKSIKKR